MTKINGVEYAGCEVKINGKPFQGLESISYETKESRASRACAVYSGTIEVQGADWLALRAAFEPTVSKYWRRRAEHERRRDKRWERRHGVYPWGRALARALRRAAASGFIVVDDEKADRVDVQLGALRDL